MKIYNVQGQCILLLKETTNLKEAHGSEPNYKE